MEIAFIVVCEIDRSVWDKYFYDGDSALCDRALYFWIGKQWIE